MKVIREPRVYLVCRQQVDDAASERFLEDYGLSWQTDTEVGAERLVEAGGRICYLSFDKGRKSNAEYIGNLIGGRHGSVLEHAVWNCSRAGVSRSFSHELVRHRAGFGYSQLSQRYGDEFDAAFVVPDIIAADERAFAIWLRAIEAAYLELAEMLQDRFRDVPDRTLRRKLARQAARSVLQGATETAIFVTANARALRHFIELRGSEGADAEIRQVALAVLRIRQREAPSIFGDYRTCQMPDGTGRCSEGRAAGPAGSRATLCPLHIPARAAPAPGRSRRTRATMPCRRRSCRPATTWAPATPASAPSASTGARMASPSSGPSPPWASKAAASSSSRPRRQRAS